MCSMPILWRLWLFDERCKSASSQLLFLTVQYIVMWKWKFTSLVLEQSSICQIYVTRLRGTSGKYSAHATSKVSVVCPFWFAVIATCTLLQRRHCIPVKWSFLNTKCIILSSFQRISHHSSQQRFLFKVFPFNWKFWKDTGHCSSAVETRMDEQHKCMA